MATDDGSSITWFDPRDGIPFPNGMVPFFRQYIEAVCVEPQAKADELAALGARDQQALNAILLAQPKPPEEQLLARLQVTTHAPRP